MSIGEVWKRLECLCVESRERGGERGGAVRLGGDEDRGGLNCVDYGM